MLPNYFHIGAAKAASTYLWRVFAEHPEICVPTHDNCSFFVCAYHKGLEWYRQTYFPHYNGQAIMAEFSNPYMLFEPALVRIKRDLGDVKLSLNLRNPIDLAYEQWVMQKHVQGELGRVWEEEMHYTIERALERSWQMFRSWIEPGFYAQHLRNVYRHFEPERVLVMFYDDLCADPDAFVKTFFEFLEVDASVESALVDQRIGFPGDKGSDTVTGDIARGLSEELRAELRLVFKDDIAELEDMTGRDLSAWT
ncbi:MAG: hypothetical protein HN742_30785 [Lentisphaerae bacterium]|mgnify:FL=1|jgi:hypothetical protein|nr:hypothetical protein [Lentisphaerota bacterium]MBT4819347.1 hypothetical protein [Lentisphaerota bacterium]MBT5609808.1 hypothetical protein [Lentisphaerota bacterium]MBT7055126.1 hypothetical protein [Lentisphaerota bacterium]MBT7846298.1 hypothetical protein [Lentisphaerota bacterium]